MEDVLVKCIICRIKKTEDCFNDEHVIPDSLAGYYHIYNVCTDCNSELGEKIDSPLVNHKLSELYRFGEKIAGKSGKIPNPFSGTFVGKDSPEKKARLDIGSSGVLELYQLPSTSWEEIDGKLQLSISVDPRDEGAIDKILTKTLARKKIPAQAVIKRTKTVDLDKSGYTISWPIDTLKFKIGLLKIAYEFAVDTLPEYFEDDAAVIISQILRNAQYDKVLDYVKIGNGLQDKIWDPFNQYLDLESRKHYLLLANGDTMGLVCLIKLHDHFAVGVVLSPKSYLKEGEMFLGINSLESQSFTKLTGAEMINKCLRMTHRRPVYSLDPGNRDEAIAEIESPSYRYEGQDNSRDIFPLYDQRGEFICHFHDAVSQNRIEARRVGSKQILILWLDPSRAYFLKALNTGKLYRIQGYEVVQEQVRKL